MTRLIVIASLLLLAAHVSRAQIGDAFAYQGSLNDGGAPASGNYDFEFSLWDDPSAGTQQGATISYDVNGADTVAVAGGVFNVPLDFGPGIFTGDARWLEIAVRAEDPTDTAPFATLAPRVELRPVPYALYAPEASHAATADSATIADTATNVINDAVDDADADPANELQDLAAVLGQGNDAGGMDATGFGSISVGGAGATYPLDITGTDTLIRFNTERPWILRQTDTGSSTDLTLQATSESKNFQILGSDGGNVATFRAFGSPTEPLVGIGTDNPETQLHVVGPTGAYLTLQSLTSGSNAQAGVSYENAQDTWYVGLRSSNNDFIFYEASNNSVHLTIEDDGDVGIGTSNPSDTLELAEGGIVLNGETTVNQSQETASNSGVFLAAYQTFTPSVSGGFARLDVYLNESSTSSAQLQIHEGDGIGGTLLHEQAVTLPTQFEGWHTIDLTTFASLQAGVLYTFYLNAGAQSIRYRWSGGNPYPGGSLSGFPGGDLAFRIHMNDGGIRFPDGSVQSTAYTAGGSISAAKHAMEGTPTSFDSELERLRAENGELAARIERIESALGDVEKL